MRAVVQRVADACVRVGNRTVGEIGPGLCILLGVGPSDNEDIAQHLANRIVSLRIFPDDADRMNRDLRESGEAALVVSQFTLYADTSRGHRPSFISAAPPELAGRLCDVFVQHLSRQHSIHVATGQFAARMRLTLTNDGPVTIVLSSADMWETDAG